LLNKRKGGDKVQITVQAKITPNQEQRYLLDSTMKEYISLVNRIVSEYIIAEKDMKYTTRDLVATLPSAVKNQAIQDAKSVFKKYTKNLKANTKRPPDQQKKIKIPILKKPVAIWNNQNYNVKGDIVSFPVIIEEKSKRIELKVIMTEYQKQLLGNRLGSLRITQKSGKYMAQIAVQAKEIPAAAGQPMGVDLGLKIPAVAVVDGGKTRFFGNGRQNKFVKRKHRSARRKLGKLKKLTAIRRRDNKEQRWMKDTDHKISRQIINYAKDNHVATIRLEKLSGIRQTARKSRKNEKNLHSWSFYRLAQYIEYKAILAGMKIEYVDPKYTSQKCPVCGERNKANDRMYKCSCGFKGHRDIVGALNIISATVIDGNSLSA
jgi:IS605 OrfB family transposase